MLDGTPGAFFADWSANPICDPGRRNRAVVTSGAIYLQIATMPETGRIPFEAAEKLLCLAEANGVPRPALLGAARVEATDGIAFSDLCRLYEDAARLTGDDAFGLHVGERTSPRMYGLLGYVAANSATFGEALANLTRFQQLWTDAVALELRSSRRTLTLSYRHRGDIPAAQRRHEHEHMLSAVLSFAREAVAQPVRPLEVRFEHEAPPDISEHRRFFDAPLLFGAPATELVLPADLLDAPLTRADLTLGTLIRGQALAAMAARRQGATLIERLRTELRGRLERGEPVSLGACAAALGAGPRTLQRRLADQGLTYRGVVEEMRTALAETLLADPTLGLAEIAFRLGYSQPSAFHRAFRQAAGTTPRGFRLNLRGG